MPTAEADVLIAMHAVKCAGVIADYRAAFPAGKVLLALTGTDIYPDPSPVAQTRTSSAMPSLSMSARQYAS